VEQRKLEAGSVRQADGDLWVGCPRNMLTFQGRGTVCTVREHCSKMRCKFTLSSVKGVLVGFMTFYVKFEVFTAVTITNVVFCDATSCGSCKNRFRGTYRLHYEGENNQRSRNNVSSN
jgi:hypothetical protein